MTDEKKPRYERKAALTDMDEKEFENILKEHPAIFSESFSERKINNMYFDSLNLRNYNEHINGENERLKIRIRWYGSLFGEIKKPMLEIKTKNRELGQKISFPLNSFMLNKLFSYKTLYEEMIKKSNLPKWTCEMMAGVSPILLNSYKRRYFMSADKKYRITLDKDMLFYRINASNNLFIDRIDDKELLLVELKYSDAEHAKAHLITQHFPFRFVANSKYLSGINLLDIV